jgi:Dirigent-like protein
MKTGTKILLVLLGLLAAVLIVSALRGDDSELSFVAPTGERSVVDLGAPGPSLGDMTVFSGELLDDDEDPAGRLDGTCTLTSAPSEEDERRWRCGVTLTVGTKNGETELQLLAVGRVEADDVIFSVVGGGGRFRDARGDATFDYTDSDRTEIVVRLED